MTGMALKTAELGHTRLLLGGSALTKFCTLTKFSVINFQHSNYGIKQHLQILNTFFRPGEYANGYGDQPASGYLSDPYSREADSGFNTFERESYDRRINRPRYDEYGRPWGPPQPPTRGSSYSNQTYMEPREISRTAIEEEKTPPPPAVKTEPSEEQEKT